MDTSSLSPAASQSASGYRIRGIEKHRVRFTGKGGAYFRLWLANLLLIIVTLGIYTPWARRRRIQYFYRNTQLGQDPLDFVASGSSMAKSFLLVVLVYALINIMSSQGLNTAVNVITLLIAAVVPWLWRSAMRFRLGSTTWRGLRFEFHASTREAYTAAWPLLGVALLPFLLFLLPESAPPGARGRGNFAWTTALGVGLAVMLLGGVVLIRLRFNFLRLQMTRTSLGGQMGGFKADFSDFLKVGLVCLGVAMLACLAVVGLVFGATAGLGGLMRSAGMASKAMMVALGLILAIPMLLIPVYITLSVWQALVFRTVWNHAGLSGMARSKCKLKTRSFVLLRTKNIFLTLLTLGLYRPFAALSEYRMKVDSVRLYTRGDVNALASRLAQQKSSALGDAAADLAGFDLA
ncbi:YjgN family protein [Polaromonas sp.]|uniref:YjgN family protein n=1 Tax=Polaromonas sp. TaxID=1869339 RepID=UPI002FCBFB6D